MDFDHTLENACVLVTSDKVKDRQQGLARYREIFSDERVLSSLPDKLDAKELQRGRPCWTTAFQALFDAVLIEKSTVFKKSTASSSSKSAGASSALQPAALTRLQDVARLISWLIDRAQLRIGRKTARAAIAHLTQMLASEKGEILTALIPPYLRSLKTLLEWKPHADHLEEKAWRDGVSVCWNLILGHKTSEKVDESKGSSLLDKYIDSNDVLTAEATALSNKTASKDNLKLSSAQAIDAFTCLQAMYASCTATLFGDEGERYGIHLLEKHVQYLFSPSSTESNVTLPALSSLNTLLRALQLNERDAVTKFASITWYQLLRYWGTKWPTLKEQLVITFDLLLCMLAVPPPPETRSALAEASAQKRRRETMNKILQLQTAIMEEANNRSGLRPLKLSTLSLRRVPDEDGTFDRPLRGTTFQASLDFEGAHAIDWAGLELAANAIFFSIRCAEEGTGISDSQDPDPEMTNHPASPEKTMR